MPKPSPAAPERKPATEVLWVTWNGRAGLTPAESRVVAAVRRGLSNPAIAAEMGWTVGTTAVCLSRIYKKLGLGGKKRDKRVTLTIETGAPK